MGVVVGVCYRWPHQQAEGSEVFLTQGQEAPQLEALDLPVAILAWESNVEWYSQSGQFWRGSRTIIQCGIMETETGF